VLAALIEGMEYDDLRVLSALTTADVFTRQQQASRNTSA